MRGHPENGTLLYVPTTKAGSLFFLCTPWFHKVHPAPWEVANCPIMSPDLGRLLLQEARWPLTCPTVNTISVTVSPESVLQGHSVELTFLSFCG